MYHIQFPGLGFNFTINPVAFTIGGHAFAWYGIIIAAGFLLAFAYAVKSCKRFRVNEDHFIDVVIVGIIGGVIGARLYFVLFSTSDQYIRNPASVFYIWEGGLGIYGGIIGGLLCGAIVAKLHKMKIAAVFDLVSLGFLIGQSIGRWGNFVNQEAFGSATSLPWRMVSERTDVVSTAGVHPCFLYESLWCLLGFILLHIFSRRFRRYDGQVFLLYVAWYGIGRFFIEGLRTDSLITPFLSLRISQVVAAASVATAIVLLVVFRRHTSLTGCGLPKIMELNAIVDEVPQAKQAEDEPILADGTSTIFENAEDAKKVLEGESIRSEGELSQADRTSGEQKREASGESAAEKAQPAAQPEKETGGQTPAETGTDSSEEK